MSVFTLDMNLILSNIVEKKDLSVCINLRNNFIHFKLMLDYVYQGTSIAQLGVRRTFARSQVKMMVR